MLLYCFIFTIGYGLIETLYRQVTTGDSTTLGQCIITFLWTPMIIYHYRNINNKIVRIILFPFNVWLCELLFGSILLYGFNIRLWLYDDVLSYFNGLITIAFFGYWVSLGIAIEIFLNIIFKEIES